MADNITPPAGSPPVTTPAPGNGTVATPGDPKVPTDPVQAAAYWENRHKEATAEITRTSQRNAQYRELFGDLEGETPPTKTPETPVQDIVKQELKAWQVDQSIERTPNLVQYADEIKGLVNGGATMNEAKTLVAARHNVAMGPSNEEQMPSVPPAGGSSLGSDDDFSPEEKAAMNREGVKLDPEKSKDMKRMVDNAWKKALRK
jgi:hypothetical protein